MWDRSASSILIISKSAEDQKKKKANSQKLGVESKSNKGNFYYS
jgi:hypothetical protein